MDEFEQLRRFRADLSAPDDRDVSRVREALAEAIEEERSHGSSVRSGSSRIEPRWRRALAGVVAAAAVIAVALVAFLPSDGDESEPAESTSLRDVGAGIQSYTSLDYDHLDTLGVTLRDVAAGADIDAERFGYSRLDADVVGIGRIVDVRLAYSSALDHMFLAVKPDRLSEGADLLGESGEVLVDVIAPPIDRATGSRGIAELRQAAVASPDRVAFMLSAVPPEGNPSDEFAGRATDDPLLRPTHPSSFFGLDEQARVAFPLLADEKLENVPGNVDPLRDLGAKIDRFSRFSQDSADPPLSGATP